VSTVQFRRLPRLAAPKMPGGEVHLEPPPEVPRVIPGNIMQKILPAVMIVAVLGMVAYAFTTRDPKNPNPLFLMFPIMMVLSTVGMFAGGGRGGEAKAAMNEDRKDYLRYLGQMRERAREAAQEQRAALEWSHPDPAALWSIAGSRRIWERRGGDFDFCHVRICRGSQRLATRLVPPQTPPVDELEPITTLALRQFVRAHCIVPELPIAISVRGFAAIGISGDPAASRGLARAMVAQLATFHAPEDLLVAVVTAGRAKVDWEWAKWLPHVQHPSRVDGAGPMRMMASSLAQIEELLGELLRDRPRFSRNTPPSSDGPHILIVIDGGEVTGAEQIILEEGVAGVTVLDLSESLGTLTSRRGLRLAIEDGAIGARVTAGLEPFGSPDSLAALEAEAVARALCPLRLGAAESHVQDEPLLGNTGLLGLLGLPEDPHAFDVAQAWRPRPIGDRLRVPIGLGEFGQPVELDIKEAAQGGMGPHGLCVGATGSGKSEFLRTLVLGLIATHSCAVLNLVLVDFKGGATFLGMEHAPHVAAVITNLANDRTLLTRMQDALAGEMNRRQELLRTAGNFTGVSDYERARQGGADLDPLPALFIVIDEFSELLAQQPEFIDLFVAIGRLGRSLQMHLLLASQRLEEGRLRGLESHLSYRIGLKTFSAGESRAVLGVPDAYELPPVPGSGYLKFDTASMERFKAAYVSGPYRPGRVVAAPSSAPVTSDRRPRLFVPDYVDLPETAEPSGHDGVVDSQPENVTEPSVLDIVVAKLHGQGPPAHEVWLPPLEAPPSLDQLLPPLSVTEDRGLSPVGFFGNGRLAVPVGMVDKPYEQRRDLLWADLSGAAGHAVATGGPQSGKSTLLRSVLMSLALTHTPEEVQFFCIDFGGGTLAALDGLPHCGGVAGRGEPDTVRRILAEVTGLLAAREQRFRARGIDSMVDFRTRKQRGELRDDPFGDVFLVIDGWHSFRQEFDVCDLEMRVVNLATQGLSYGVHVMIGATRWAEIRPALKDLLGTRFELRLGDPGESDIDRRVAVNVPPGRPGRGLSRDKLHFLAALPRIDAVTSAQDVGTGVADAVARIRDGWAGQRAPRVRLLPERIPYQQLPMPAQQRPHLIPIGINEAELTTVYLDFAAEPHFLCFADSESGKTTLLRTIARGLVDRATPEQARIVIVDYRRTMLGFVESDHLIGYGMSADVLTPIISDVQSSMRKRLPGPGVTQQQLRDRSWWSGPELYVLVDDYDLVATHGGPNPLAPLLEFLAQAKDVGLHLILARRCGGASRALFEPVIARLRELSAPGIVMSGNPEEGPLLGSVKPSPMPPGRGTLVERRAGRQLVQLAWLAPD
jgi:DNA segregation ATPase FtsK/SpoIIIE, S-DNA-T family